MKYNDTHGGPADTDVTGWIQRRANQILAEGLSAVQRVNFATAMLDKRVEQRDFALDYINDLENVVDMAVISRAKVKIAVDPLGGSGMGYWALIAKRYQLNIEVINDQLDPRFAFVPPGRGPAACWRVGMAESCRRAPRPGSYMWRAGLGHQMPVLPCLLNPRTLVIFE